MIKNKHPFISDTTLYSVSKKGLSRKYVPDPSPHSCNISSIGFLFISLPIIPCRCRISPSISTFLFKQPLSVGGISQRSRLNKSPRPCRDLVTVVMATVGKVATNMHMISKNVAVPGLIPGCFPYQSPWGAHYQSNPRAACSLVSSFPFLIATRLHKTSALMTIHQASRIERTDISSN